MDSLTLTNILLIALFALLWTISTQIDKVLAELRQIKRLVARPYGEDE